MIYESIILSFLTSISNRIVYMYKHCGFHKAIGAVISFVNRLFEGSKICAFIMRPDFFTRVMMKSTIISGLVFIVNIPVNICKKCSNSLLVFLKHSNLVNIFNKSFFGYVLQVLNQRMPTLIAFVLALIMVVKHDWWNNVYSTIFVAVLLILFLVKSLSDHSLTFDIKALDFAFILFVLCTILSMVTSSYPRESVKSLIFYTTDFIFVLLIVSTIKSKKDFKFFITLILAGVTLTSLYGLYQYKIGVPIDPQFTDTRINEGMPGRIYSTMDNANNFAEFLVMFIPVYAAAFLNAEKIKTKLLFLLAVLPALASLLLTGSRSGMGAVALSIFVFLVFKNWRLIPVGFVAGLIALPLLPQWAYKRFMTIFNPNDSSISYREKIYEKIAPMFKQFWVTGVGLGNEAFAAMSKQFDILTRGTTPHAHNLFVQVWLEMGIVGVLVFVWLVVRTLKKCSIKIFEKPNIHRRQSNFHKHILMAGASGIVSVLIIGLVEHIWFYPRNMLFFWVLLGLIFAALNAREEAEDVQIFKEKKQSRLV